MTNLDWPGKILEWTLSSPLGKDHYGNEWLFQGLELFFDENDAGSFEEYRCYDMLHMITGTPFSILVEGIIELKK